MTGGPLLVVDFVGESGAKGLLERRRSSGELGGPTISQSQEQVEESNLTFLLLVIR